MVHILDTVGELTDLRNLYQLETSFTELVLQLAKARQVTLWYVGKNNENQLELERRTSAGANNTDDSASVLYEHFHLLENNKSVCIPETDKVRYLFHIMEGRILAAVIEVLTCKKLDNDTENNIQLLVRVFGNHTNLLNYGQCDELTGLRNRRSFNHDFSHISQHDKGTAIIAVADIDHFKRINDKLGHLYGDEVLILIARMIRSAFRKSDGVYRMGGEEFVVIMRNTELADAERALDAFRDRVAKTDFPQIGQITVSVGFSAVRDLDDASEAFGRADDALYVAKNSGRNLTLCHEWLVASGVLPQLKGAPRGTFELF